MSAKLEQGTKIVQAFSKDIKNIRKSLLVISETPQASVNYVILLTLFFYK
jgi:hypothetical protein